MAASASRARITTQPRRLAVAAVLAGSFAACLALAGEVRAQAPGFYDEIGEIQAGGSTPGSGRGTSVGGEEGPAEVLPTGGRGRVVKRCTRTRRKRTCRYLRGGRLLKVCVKRRGRRQGCRIVGSGAAAAGQRGRRAEAARLQRHGYTNPILPGVVRFYWEGNSARGGGWCSGTLVRRGIVLTAAHCLYPNANEPYQNQYYDFFYQDYGAMTIAPGNYTNQGQPSYPYGIWKVASSWVPTGWQNEDGGLDWALAVIEPDANGNYPGDYTGTYSAYWNANLPVGTRFYNVGYPMSNAFFTAAFSFGNGQYHCDSVWDGQNANGSDPNHASSWAIVIDPCPMNGGASGGPVFAQFRDGSWGIISVNNRGINRADGFGGYNISFWFDDRFGEFWNSAINAISNARASSRSGSGPTAAVSSSSRGPTSPSPGLGAETR
jgi:hypothetical protein